VYLEIGQVLVVDAASVDRQRARQRDLHEPQLYTMSAPLPPLFFLSQLYTMSAPLPPLYRQNPEVYLETGQVLVVDAASVDRQRARQRDLHEPSHDQIVALITRLGTASRYAGLDAAAVAVGGGAAARRRGA